MLVLNKMFNGLLRNKGELFDIPEIRKETSDDLSQLEYISSSRQLENDIEEIDLSERIDYLAYQEQLRTKHVIGYLTRVLSLEKYKPPIIKESSLSHGNYFQIRCDQMKSS